MRYDENLRRKLIELGPEQLADALLDLASRNDEVEDVLKRMASGSAANIKRYKTKLAALKRSKRFYDWRDVSEFARQLNGILHDLQAGVDDPCVGVELVADFFKCDNVIFERADDSGGNIGDVFTYTAKDLFARYAFACTNKTRVLDLVEALYAEDEYGVRGALVDAACKSLPDASLRELADRFWKRTEAKDESVHAARRWLIAVESLAKQLRDPNLYEKASLATSPRRSGQAFLKIAEVWLDAGDAQTALSWVERVPEEEAKHPYDLDRLLLSIYAKLGDKGKLSETAWRIFHEYRSMDNLSALLSVIGEENRERVIDQESREILGSETFSSSDTEFLMLTGRSEEAASYILEHAGQLNGDHYTSLVPLAESMEKNKHWLVASIIYRALLDSILGRAASKYYHHGVRYLKKLDHLEQEITDWQEFHSHVEYTADLRKVHGRKSSFWSRYGE